MGSRFVILNFYVAISLRYFCNLTPIYVKKFLLSFDLWIFSEQLFLLTGVTIHNREWCYEKKPGMDNRFK